MSEFYKAKLKNYYTKIHKENHRVTQKNKKPLSKLIFTNKTFTKVFENLYDLYVF
jgi:hypothetical protein